MSITLVSTMLIATGLIVALGPIAQKVDLVDRPNARKAHLHVVPLVGGLGIYAAFVIVTMLLWPQYAPGGAFFIASAVLVAGGLLDDFLDVPAFAKLAFQIAAVLVMTIAGGMAVDTLGELVPGVGAVPLGFLAIPFTLVAAIGIINAVNLSDGLDGLAGFQLAVAFAALTFLAARGGDAANARDLLILIACVVGFLIFNARVFGRKRAVVFLGDAGTMFLGFAYVWFAIALSTGSNALMSPVTALWLLAVPICDTVTMLIRRVSRGRSPFKADKEHLHHVLMMAGFTAGETVMILTGFAVAAAGIGLAGEVFAIADSWMLLGFLVVGALYLRVILRSWTVMRFLRWSICRRRAVGDRRANFEKRQEDRGVPGGATERRKNGERRRNKERRTRDLAAAAAHRNATPLLPTESRTAEEPAKVASDALSADAALQPERQRT